MSKSETNFKSSQRRNDQNGNRFEFHPLEIRYTESFRVLATFCRSCFPPPPWTGYAVASELRASDFELPNRYGREGKTPCMAMQKFRTRNGIMLLCGKSPPATANA